MQTLWLHDPGSGRNHSGAHGCLVQTKLLEAMSHVHFHRELLRVQRREDGECEGGEAGVYAMSCPHRWISGLPARPPLVAQQTCSLCQAVRVTLQNEDSHDVRFHLHFQKGRVVVTRKEERLLQDIPGDLCPSTSEILGARRNAHEWQWIPSEDLLIHVAEARRCIYCGTFQIRPREKP